MGTARQLVLASSNPGKLRELRELLAATDIEVIPQSQFDLPDAVENGSSFFENALIKARHAVAKTGLPALADDSGLEVDVLDGAPGIQSARFAGDGATDEQNLRLLLERIAETGSEQPAARYRCVIVCLQDPGDPDPLVARGTWEGRIVSEPKGANGFGYDPVFFVPGYDCTAAELPPDVKNRISHRGKALREVLRLLEKLEKHT